LILTKRIRYVMNDVIDWQKRCQRVVPENWQPTGSLPGEPVPAATDRIQWLLIGQAAAAIGLAIPTLTAWRKPGFGVPFISIGGRGAHPFMYDRRDLDAFITRRKADPSVVPVIVKKVYGKDPRTPEERKRMMAEIWMGMGHTDDEIKRMLGPRFVELIWPI
jgi:hypothetical protein